MKFLLGFRLLQAEMNYNITASYYYYESHFVHKHPKIMSLKRAHYSE